MTQYLNEDHGRGPVLLGSGSAMEQFLLLGTMEAMKSPGGKILVGCDMARPGSDRTGEALVVLHDEMPFYLH